MPSKEVRTITDGEHHVTHEYKLIQVRRDITRVIVLRRISEEDVPIMLSPDLPNESESIADIQQTFVDSSPRYLFLTDSTWLHKGGTKSNDQLMLAGGGNEKKEITPDTIRETGIREVKEELGAQVASSHVLLGASRTYAFTTPSRANPGFVTQQTNTEYLMVAKLRKHTNLAETFTPTENIRRPVFLTPQDVSDLLATDIYIDASGHPIYLLDSLSLNQARRKEKRVVVNMAELYQTRNIIEFQSWLYEAKTQRKLCEKLLKITQSKVPILLRDEFSHSISKVPITIPSAQQLVADIQRMYQHIESSYPKTLTPRTPLFDSSIRSTLQRAHVSASAIQNRELIIEEMHSCVKSIYYPT